MQAEDKRSESDGAEAQIARSLDRASQASKARQEVLTDYAKSMTALVTQKGLDDKPVKEPVEKEQVENLATAATLVALRRLDDGRDSVISEFDLVKEDVEAQFTILNPQDDNSKSKDDTVRPNRGLESEVPGKLEANIPKSRLAGDAKGAVTGDNKEKEAKKRAEVLQNAYLQGFDTEGKFKGHLIRFLYESQLINGDETRVELSGANVTSVDLNDAFLPDINLERAWLTWGTFKNADLRRVNLTGADLRKADLTGA